MLHPIFSVLVSKPELVLEHVAGYAALVREEASSVGLSVAKRTVAWALALVAALVFLILAGVAAMLGAIHEFHWMLVAVPGVALAISLASLLVARQPLPEKAFAELKAQIEADVQALRAIRARA